MGGNVSGGISGGSQKGSSNTTSQYSGTTRPIIPDDWTSVYNGLGNTLGSTGVTTGQQSNIDALKNLANGQHDYTNAGYYSLQSLSDKFGGQWATPTDVTAQPVAAQQGSDFMGAYKNPWDQNVIDTSVNDYNTNVDRTLNGLRAGRDASGAFGDRAAIADASYLGDATRGLGSLVSGLRQAGFNTAAQLGQSDAGRFLNASTTNAANKFAADTFNNNLTNSRQQFSVNEALQGDQNRMQAMRDIQNNVLAQNAIQQGGVDNLSSLLSLGTHTFGQSADGQSESMTNNASKSKGGNVGYKA